MKTFEIYEAITRGKYGRGTHFLTMEDGELRQFWIEQQIYVVCFNFDGTFKWVF